MTAGYDCASCPEFPERRRRRSAGLAATRLVALDFPDERPPSSGGEAKTGHSRVLAVTHPDEAVDSLTDFHAVTVRSAVGTLSPRCAIRIN
jgi:hypothetical protein